MAAADVADGPAAADGPVAAVAAVAGRAAADRVVEDMAAAAEAEEEAAAVNTDCRSMPPGRTCCPCGETTA